mmetsp:Transcript_75700/g.215503  ORF Transcript_75700/g.215503 Transcript_75700/m.215503 type:complete len:266 (+) Transcript_75700:608-1405(+)
MRPTAPARLPVFASFTDGHTPFGRHDRRPAAGLFESIRSCQRVTLSQGTARSLWRPAFIERCAKGRKTFQHLPSSFTNSTNATFRSHRAPLEIAGSCQGAISAYAARPTMACIVESANGHPDFPLNNLPYGIFSPQGLDDPTPRVGVAIGDMVLDLSVAATSGLFEGVGENPSEFWVKIFSAPALNDFMALGKPAWQAVRAQLNNLLTGAETSSLVESALVPIETVAMLLPAKIGDYTDFYASREHATNIGTMFRGKDNALQPNW